MDKKRLMQNMITSIISVMLSTMVSFFITSRIVEKIGGEAYGFVKLSNDFTSYASLITIALNSMASRYVMISLNQGDKDEAKKYYNSVFFANVVLSAILLIPAIIVVIYCNLILNVPSEILFDVQLNFVIVFTNFLVSLSFSTISQSYYLTNRLYLGSIREMQSTIIRTVLIIVLFIFSGTKIYYLALASLITNFYVIGWNIYYRRKLIPDFNLDIHLFEWEKVKKLLTSGIWNSITKLSQLFSSGLDLLITNIFIDAANMGTLSIAKTIPNMVVGFNASISGSFNPDLTKLYAQKRMDDLVDAVKSAMRIMCMFVSIPNAIMVAVGSQLFHLWVPSQPESMLQILSVITLSNSVITGVLQPIYSIFTVIDKVKQNSIVMIIYGSSSILITLCILYLTDWGVYAVAAVSAILSIFVALSYHLPMSAKYLGLSKFTFFPEIIISIISFVLLSGVGYVVAIFIPAGDSWVMWFVAAIVIGILGIILNMMLVLKKEERHLIFNKIKSKIHGVK